MTTDGYGKLLRGAQRSAIRRTRGGCWADADDAAQEAMVKLIMQAGAPANAQGKGIPEGKGGSDTGAACAMQQGATGNPGTRVILDEMAWVKVNAARIASKITREQKRLLAYNEQDASQDGAAGFVLAGTGMTPDELAQKHEIGTYLPQLLDRFCDDVLLKLDPVDFQLLILRHAKDLTFEKMGDVLGVLPGTVRKQYYRLMLGLHGSLLRLLQSWNVGRELFLEALEDAKHLNGFMALVLIKKLEGTQALDLLVEAALADNGVEIIERKGWAE